MIKTLRLMLSNLAWFLSLTLKYIWYVADVCFVSGFSYLIDWHSKNFKTKEENFCPAVLTQAFKVLDSFEQTKNNLWMNTGDEMHRWNIVGFDVLKDARLVPSLEREGLASDG